MSDIAMVEDYQDVQQAIRLMCVLRRQTDHKPATTQAEQDLKA